MKAIDKIRQSGMAIKVIALGLICLMHLLCPKYAASQADTDQAAQNLSHAIQFKTISHYDPSLDDPVEFLGFIQFLEETYPLIHDRLVKEAVSDYSLLYTWQGSDPEANPIVLISHMDVVPIETGTGDAWTYPPFEGRIADGFIWGRGTLDVKCGLMGIMEAVETLLTQGYNPLRTIYLAFGHDEEVMGTRGALPTAALLASRGVKAECILDEGGHIISGIAPGLHKPASIIGIAEKGVLTVELSVEQEGGHAMIPPPHSAIGILCSAIHRLEQRQFPARFGGATKQMLEFLAPEMDPPYNIIFGNTMLFGGVIKLIMAQSNEMNASIRTVFSTTIFQGGTQFNVLPQNARAVVSFRILPGEGIQDVAEHAIEAVDDPTVTFEIIGTPVEPSSITDIESRGFKVIEQTIHQLFPETVVAPYLMLGGTDSKHYREISDTILRFIPTRFSSEDTGRSHGTDERISVDNYIEVVTFYMELIRNFIE